MAYSKMKKYGAGIITLSVLGASIGTAMAYDDSNGKDYRGNSSYGHEQKSMMGQMNQGHGMAVMSFLKTDLTDEQRVEFKKSVEAFHTSMKDYLASNDSADAETKKAKLTSLAATFIENTAKFVIEEKYSNYKETVYKMTDIAASGKMPMGGKDMVEAPKMAGDILSFMRTDLSEDEKSQVRKILDTNKANMMAIMSDTTLSADEKKVKHETLCNEFINSLSPFVSTEKLEEFKKFVLERHLNMSHMPVNNGQKNNNKRTESDRSTYAPEKSELKNTTAEAVKAKPKYKMLSAKTLRTLDKAINKVDEATRLEYVNKLIERVTVLTAQATGKRKNLLDELSVYLNNKKDELVSSTEEDTVINSIIR